MPDIKYVCLSDMHLGEEDSLLTNLKTANRDTDPLFPSPVLQKLVDCLRFLIEKNENPKEKPVLILNGDILELALTTVNEAAMVFERFIELAMPPDNELFSEIIYIPGNHDHHLWESARETQYVNYINTLDAGTLLKVPWHTTNMFFKDQELPVRAYFLTSLIQRIKNMEKFVIHTAYPNFGLFDPRIEKCVLFTHGHYIEPLYMLMSYLRSLIVDDRAEPVDIWDIEAENFAWIDFFWSTMGRSGDIGKDIELIYEKIHYPDKLKQLLHTLAHNIAKKYNLIPLLGEKSESFLLEKCFDFIADRMQNMERSHMDGPLSPKAESGLRSYIKGPLRKQIQNELDIDIPRDVTIVFGHTHKPFEADMNFKYYPEWVNVYNTGGWVIENTAPQPLHGGAIVLIDENLNAASLRMYNEEKDAEDYRVEVKQAGHPQEPKSPFFTKLSELVDNSKEPFKSYNVALARAINVRRENLKERINENP